MGLGEVEVAEMGLEKVEVNMMRTLVSESSKSS